MIPSRLPTKILYVFIISHISHACYGKNDEERNHMDYMQTADTYW
jgi:hypothetical protein